jgi:hypothetical protein
MDTLVQSGEFNKLGVIVSPINSHLIAIPLILGKI